MRDLLDLVPTGEEDARLAELHELAAPTLDELARALTVDRAFVAFFDVEKGGLRGAMGFGAPQPLLDEFPPALLQSLRRGVCVLVEDTLRDSRLPESVRELCLDLGMLAFAVIPLLPVSAVLVVSKDRPFTEDEVRELLSQASRLTGVIAERQEVRRLRESSEQHAITEEWLWWMLNAVPDPVLLSGPNNEVMLCNVHGERLLVASPADSPGKRRAIQLNNVLLSAALSRFTLDQGASLGRELTLVDPIEGHEILFEMISQPATNIRSGEQGLVTVLKNVTDLRRATEQERKSLTELQAAIEEARRERDQLDLILENVADPIVVTDPAGQITLMNHQAESFLQPPADAPPAQVTTYLANEAKLSSFLAQLRLEAAPARRGELQLVDPQTDETRAMLVTASEVPDALGQVTATVAVMHDLTHLRELEQRRVEQQLFESQKLAAVGRLAAAVAHEVNNPLEAIKNALHLVVSTTPADHPNRRFLEIASQETQRVSGIIRQMLGLYRPASEKVSLNVNQVVEDVAALLQRQLRLHKVTLQLEVDPSLPRVLASPDQLKQVLLNLFLNAQEAMPTGGTLHVVTRQSRETDHEFLPGRFVLIQVRDTGAGIPEEDLARIFEPFYSTKTDARGTGLGLWVSLGIIRDHGGQITVRSRPGRGTTFTIALPPEEGP